MLLSSLSLGKHYFQSYCNIFSTCSTIISGAFNLLCHDDRCVRAAFEIFVAIFGYTLVSMGGTLLCSCACGSSLCGGFIVSLF